MWAIHHSIYRSRGHITAKYKQVNLSIENTEVNFGTKLKKPVLSELSFNNSHVGHTECQNHLGLILDNKLIFNEHLKGVLDKISKTIGLPRKLQPILPRFSLLTIYKTFVRKHFSIS